MNEEGKSKGISFVLCEST